jgi:hypothetical protein
VSADKRKYCRHHRTADKFPYPSSIKEKCKRFLYRKISLNMRESRQKGWSPRQAVAISYSEVRKRNPECKKYFTKSKKSEKYKSGK